MWHPVYLRIVNFMSHQDTLFEFVKGHVVMIKGQNDYDREPKSNGAGKSGLIEGTSVAFTGEVIRNVNTPNIIKDGCDSANVEFLMKNSMTDELMLINRTMYRSKNKYASLMITVNGVEKKFAKVAHGNQLILDMIGITEEDLYNYYIISKKKYKSFFYSTDGDKRKLISRFSNANIIDGVYGEIDSDVKTIDDEIKTLESDKNISNGRISAYQEQIDDKGETVSKDQLIDELLESIEVKGQSMDADAEFIEKHEENVKTLEKNKKLKDAEILKEETALAKMPVTDFAKQKKKLNDENKELSVEAEEYEENVKEAEGIISAVEEDIKEIEGKVAVIDRKLLNKIACPKCKHEFSFKDAKLDMKVLDKEKADYLNDIEALKIKITEAQDVIKDINIEVAKVDEKIDGVNKKLRGLEVTETNELSAINTKKRLISTLKTELSAIGNKITTAKSEIKSLEEKRAISATSIGDMNREINEIRNRKEDTDPSVELKNKITECEKDIINTDAKILEKNRVKADKSKWSELYKRFNVKLSNMAIKSIEGLANQIQSKMGSNLSLSIDGYKINRDGSVSDQITANVLRYGAIEGTFFRFSEGEQGRLNISATMAMQQLINMSCKTGGLDLTFIDEITESLDTAGIASIVKSLDKLGRTIAIITHVSDEMTIIPNEIIVVKTAEGSKILGYDID